MNLILLISGPIAVGKSSVVSNLIDNYEFRKLSSGEHLVKLAKEKSLIPNRQTLTRIGDELDIDTDYSWVVNTVTKTALNRYPEVDRWIFDSVRKKRQVRHFRTAFHESIMHIHLTADESVLKCRYENRQLKNPVKDHLEYEVAITTPNETESRSLETIADHVIDTSHIAPIQITKKMMEIIFD